MYTKSTRVELAKDGVFWAVAVFATCLSAGLFYGGFKIYHEVLEFPRLLSVVGGTIAMGFALGLAFRFVFPDRTGDLVALHRIASLALLIAACVIGAIVAFQAYRTAGREILASAIVFYLIVSGGSYAVSYAAAVTVARRAGWV